MAVETSALSNLLQTVAKSPGKGASDEGDKSLPSGEESSVSFAKVLEEKQEMVPVDPIGQAERTKGKKEDGKRETLAKRALAAADMEADLETERGVEELRALKHEKPTVRSILAESVRKGLNLQRIRVSAPSEGTEGEKKGTSADTGEEAKAAPRKIDLAAAIKLAEKQGKTDPAEKPEISRLAGLLRGQETSGEEKGKTAEKSADPKADALKTETAAEPEGEEIEKKNTASLPAAGKEEKLPAKAKTGEKPAEEEKTDRLKEKPLPAAGPVPEKSGKTDEPAPVADAGEPELAETEEEAPEPLRAREARAGAPAATAQGGEGEAGSTPDQVSRPAVLPETTVARPLRPALSREGEEPKDKQETRTGSKAKPSGLASLLESVKNGPASDAGTAREGGAVPAGPAEFRTLLQTAGNPETGLNPSVSGKESGETAPETDEQEETGLRKHGAVTSASEEVKLKIQSARTTLAHFSTHLKEAAENYKPPVMKVSMELAPEKLGNVEVTLLQRGKNLQVSIHSNPSALQMFMNYGAEFRSSLENSGFQNVNVTYNMSDGSANNGGQGGQSFRQQQEQERQRQGQEAYRNSPADEGEHSPAIDEIVVTIPTYG